MVTLVKHDLEFILKQIKIAEAHTAAIADGDTPAEIAAKLSAIVNTAGGAPGGVIGANQSALMPFGLRTVDGSFNNFTPGGELLGSSSQLMDRLLDPVFKPAEGSPAGLHAAGTPAGPATSYAQPNGIVYDSQPRVISNLVADQTLNNPAAIAAALAVTGLSGGELYTAVNAIRAAYTSESPQLVALLDSYGIQMDGINVLVPNVSADLGDTAPFNSFFTIFGQFFDHGLDLTSKGGSGQVLIPLSQDDPLYGQGPTNFMVLTRATNQPGADGILGTADDIRENGNETTPWIDLNQVYTSNASHQVFLREYAQVAGKAVATGHMLEGSAGGPPTWADVKAHAKSMLGIELKDADVNSVPLLATDLYGEFVRGTNGYAMATIGVTFVANGLVVGRAAFMKEGHADGLHPSELTLADLQAAGVVVPEGATFALSFASAGRAFLNDIAHAAAPTSSTGAALPADGDTGVGYFATDPDGNGEQIAGPVGNRANNLAYDNELLDRHFIVGDGRGNENIALTSIHTVFHGEHNRQVDDMKATVLATGDLAFINEWLADDIAEIPGTASEIAALVWDGERLFQAARFSTEMVYQHLVFEEFARAVAPQVDAFLFSNTVDIDPAISQEFAQVVYRFGHSMLNEHVDVFGIGGVATDNDTPGLIESFLNPIKFESYGTGADAAEEAAGAILRGMSRQRGNEIDEFMTDALRNNLVGLPLDLAALNMARARETGIPSLNEARRQFYEQTNDTYLKPYESWTDFAQNIKNPLSVVNFIAAYGTHDAITSATTVEAKRDAAWLLVVGDGSDGDGVTINGVTYTDRLDFLNARAEYAGGSLGGLNDVDFWIGGLAEAKMAFGGMLGSTFTFVFENQMERLQEGDRFYYLSRTQGLNLLNQLEADSFAELLRRNTDTEHTGLHINGAAFQTADFILEMNQSKQWNAGLGNADPTGDDPILGGMLGGASLVERGANSIKFLGDQHVVLGGTDGNDRITGGSGDDTLWGEGGDDDLEGGFGVDHIFGGEGDDLITDKGSDIGEFDVIHGDAGNDVINPGMGLDLVFGGAGQDFIFGGGEDKTISGGLGNDFIRGGEGFGFLLGNEGDDWIEGGDSFDTLAGENSELFFNSTIIGHDVLNGRGNDNDYDAESGDDIMFQGPGIQRNNGMAGFDWAIHKGDAQGADSDMNVSIFTNQQNNILRDRFDLVEGLSGWQHNDRLVGRDFVVGGYDANGNAAQVDPTLPFDSWSNALLQKNVALVDGLDDLVAHLTPTVARDANGAAFKDAAGMEARVVMDTSDGSDILLGGGGSDSIEGKGGNDIIDGDRWLNVRIQFTKDSVTYTTDGLGEKVWRLADYVNGAPVAGAVAAFDGRTLDQLMFSRTVNPGLLEIKREIVDGGKDGDVDTVVFWDVRANYEITTNSDGSITVNHVNPTVGAVDAASGKNRESDGIDRLWNVERIEFADQTLVLTPPELKLNGFDAGPTFTENFSSTSYTADDGAWTQDWIETDDNNSSNSGQIRIAGSALTFEDGNGASITRQIDLSAAAETRLTYSIQENGFDPGETVEVLFAADGTNFVRVELIDNNTGNANRTVDLTGPFASNAAIRFVVSNVNGNNESVEIDNISFQTLVPAAVPSKDHAFTYVEQANAQSIASLPDITSDRPEIASARIVLTNPQTADELNVGSLAGTGISASAPTLVGGQLVVTLTGAASHAAYERAIQAITFSNDSDTPSATPRIVEVTVNDGFLTSAVARTTITVTPVDDPINAVNDDVITNLAQGQPIVIPEWALLLNDVDPDSVPDITALQGINGLTAALGNGFITVTDTGNAGGEFDYRATGAPGNSDLAQVDVTSVGSTRVFAEDFASTSYTQSDGIWTDDWVESGDQGDGNATVTNGNPQTLDNGQIRILGERLEFDGGNNTGNSNGASIQRGLSGLAGANSASISLNFGENIDAGETVTIEFSRDGVTTQTLQTITSNSGSGSLANLALTGPFTSNAFLRFTVSTMNTDNDVAWVDNISISASFPPSLNGTAGSEILIDGNVGATIDGGAGNDVILANGGNDTIVWNANAASATSNANSDGRDIVDGGDGDDDTFVINGNTANNVAETYRIYSRAAADEAGLTVLNDNTEIVVTRGGTTNAAIIAELDNVEEIVVNTDNGNDTVQIIGDFNPSSLDINTITINGGAGNDIVDFSALQSEHRIVFRSNGGNDTIIGTVRPQDVIELPNGNTLLDYEVAVSEDGRTVMTGPDGTTITFVAPGGQPIFGNDDDQDDEDGFGAAAYLDREDVGDLRDMVRDGFVRDASGVGNNIANPTWGAANNPFIRLTDAYYEDGVSQIRETQLTAREISDIVSNQDNDNDGVEESIVNSFGGSSLLTFFGQYFDHGLGFVAKGNPGSVAIGSSSFPISAPRSNIIEGTGTEAGNPAQYENHTSPYVDQNQTYGSHNAITDLLRKWEAGGDGAPTQSAYLLTGETDASGNPLLPTLAHIRENYRIMTGGEELTAEDIADYDGTGHPLLIDFIPAFTGTPPRLDLDAIGHYFVTGDGRANENVMLSSIHTIWARNHNFWVDELREATGGSWTEQEYFEAARIMNVAEYQRVVFTEFAAAIAGPLGDDDDGVFDPEHGFEEYDAAVDASISVEFAQAVYRFGHSMLNETVSYVDANGELQEMSLVDAFLQPQTLVDKGIDGLLAGAIQTQHQAIDVDVVNALRNQLVGRPLDLAALNIFRGRDMGVAPLNIMRAQLFEATGNQRLRPYEDWEDFQARNDLTDAFMAQLKAAYPDGIDTMDAWVGGLAEKPVYGQLGSTFGFIFREQMDRLQHGDRFYYLEILDDSIFQENAQTFSDLIMRNTGLTNLPENAFGDISFGAVSDDDEDEDDDGIGNDDDADDDDDAVGSDDDDDDEAEDDEDDAEDDDDLDEDDDDDDAGAGPGTQPSPVNIAGTPQSDVLVGSAGNDTLDGFASADTLIGNAGADALRGGDGDDYLSGGNGRDMLFGGAGNDDMAGGADADMIYGDDGDDRIFGDEGDDFIDAGKGNDIAHGGAGSDLFVAAIGDGNDTYYGDDPAASHAGSDTLDMSAITAAITADLGTGFNGRGSAASSQSGIDVLWGIENIVTGSGNDVITASSAINVIDGGAGNDTFRFLSSADADDDTIMGFQPGDRLDLSAINAGSADGKFTIVSGSAFQTPGALAIEHQAIDGQDFTFVKGNVDGGSDAEFTIRIKGHHALTASDIDL